MERKVLRQEVLWIPKERRVPFPDTVEGVNLRVWTLYPYCDETVRPQLPYKPVHHQNAFLEDHIHDWYVEKGVLRYYSRAMDSQVWILVEHLEPLKKDRRKR